MACDHDTIRRLLSRWEQGLTTLEEERTLRSYFASARGLPPDLAAAAALFDYFGAAAQQRYRGPLPRRRALRWRLAAAACAALIAGAAILLTLPVGESQTVYCYIDGRPVTDPDQAARAVAYLSRLERIEAPAALLDQLWNETFKTPE